MEKRTYTVASLRETLRAFEQAYGLSTEDFVVAHAADDESVLESVPNGSRGQWAMFERTFRRMCGGGLAAHVSRGLEVA